MTWEEAVLSFRDVAANAEFVRACFYDDPLMVAAKRYYASSEWSAIARLLPPTRGKALDIGSGRGISAFALAIDGWQVAALEPDPSAIVGAAAIRSLAAEAGVAIEVHEEWGERLPFDDANFDLVHCRAVLHHAHDLKQLCREIGRVLKPGGMFIAAREHVVSRHEDIPVFQASHPLHGLYGGEYAYLVSEYRSAIKNAGLVLLTALNPLASDINLFPETKATTKRRWARRLMAPQVAMLIPDALLRWRGEYLAEPGRLFSFIAVKPTADH